MGGTTQTTPCCMLGGGWYRHDAAASVLEMVAAALSWMYMHGPTQPCSFHNHRVSVADQDDTTQPGLKYACLPRTSGADHSAKQICEDGLVPPIHAHVVRGEPTRGRMGVDQTVGPLHPGKRPEASLARTGVQVLSTKPTCSTRSCGLKITPQRQLGSHKPL